MIEKASQDKLAVLVRLEERRDGNDGKWYCSRRRREGQVPCMVSGMKNQFVYAIDMNIVIVAKIVPISCSSGSGPGFSVKNTPNQTPMRFRVCPEGPNQTQVRSGFGKKGLRTGLDQTMATLAVAVEHSNGHHGVPPPAAGVFRHTSPGIAMNLAHLHFSASFEVFLLLQSHPFSYFR